MSQVVMFSPQMLHGSTFDDKKAFRQSFQRRNEFSRGHDR